MTELRQFAPIFKGKFPAKAESRWEGIRHFINQWSRPTDAPVPATCDIRSQLLGTPLAAYDGRLSYSIRQWLALIENAVALDAPYIRDCLVIQPIEEFFTDPAVGGATVIFMSGESDVYWAVENDHLQDDDPPVHVYQNYDESSPAFVGRSGSVSEFALKYVCLSNEHAVGAKEWFSANGMEDNVRAVVDWFDYALTFDADGLFARFGLLESDNIAAIVNGTRVEVSVFCDPATLAMPKFLRSQMDEHVRLRQRIKKSLHSP